MTPIDYDSDGVIAKIYPPVRAVASDGKRPLSELAPAKEQTTTNQVIVNGTPTVPANLLRVEIRRDDFDRRAGKDVKYDPPTALFFQIVNWWLERLRVVSNAAYLRPLMEAEPHRIEYLNDDGTPVPNEMPEKYRQRFGKQHRLDVTAIDVDLWNRIKALGPKYEPPRYQTLILDAYAVLPDVGSAIVLAATALETVIGPVLEVLAQREGGKFEKLWNWVSDRNAYWQEPSLADLFGDILAISSGKSLADDNALWEAFKNLKEARNNFVHEGHAMIGDRSVTSERAAKLIEKADAIIKWMAQMLPEEMRPQEPSKHYEIQGEFFLTF
jgi:hypothetical protein